MQDLQWNTEQSSDWRRSRLEHRRQLEREQNKIRNGQKRAMAESME